MWGLLKFEKIPVIWKKATLRDGVWVTSCLMEQAPKTNSYKLGLILLHLYVSWRHRLRVLRSLGEFPMLQMSAYMECI